MKIPSPQKSVRLAQNQQEQWLPKKIHLKTSIVFQKDDFEIAW